jgi:LysR family glycine cleavage system transcriptional activator
LIEALLLNAVRLLTFEGWPTWRQWLATAGLIDPSHSATDKTWALSFREELHAVDAVVAG